ncbi:MAG: hypothetical protein E7632_02040 [Ruminococcaceae bacterium]|nr:hypothetical protein [Oscillospiraceae bacterium]
MPDEKLIEEKSNVSDVQPELQEQPEQQENTEQENTPADQPVDDAKQSDSTDAPAPADQTKEDTSGGDPEKKDGTPEVNAAAQEQDGSGKDGTVAEDDKKQEKAAKEEGDAKEESPGEKSKLPKKNTPEREEYLQTKFVKSYKDAKAEEKATEEALRKELAEGDAAGTKKDDSTDKGKSDPKNPTKDDKGQTGQQGTGQAAKEESFAPRAALAEGTKESDSLGVVDDIMEGLGTISGHAGDAGNIAADVKDLQGDEDSNVGDITALTSGLAGTALNGYGTIRGIMKTNQARKNGNSVGLKSGIWDNMGSILSLGGDVTNVASGIAGLAGAKSAGDIGNVVGGSLGALGSISSLVGSSYRVTKHRQGENKLSEMAKGVKDEDLEKSSGSLRDKGKSLKKLDKNATADDKAAARASLNDYDKARRARNSLKARKFAAEMASDQAHHERKKDRWDILQNLSGMMSGLAGIGGGIAGMLGSSVGKLIQTVASAAINIIGTVAKTKNFASDKKHDSSHKEKFVAQYMARKREAIMQEANTSDVPEEDKITAGEAENIVLARLDSDKITVDKLSGESQLAANKDAVFKILCEKRAENIHQADDETRTEILTAMGLDPKKATKQAIIEALGG